MRAVTCSFLLAIAMVSSVAGQSKPENAAIANAAAEDAATNGPDWDALTGTWILESADQDGENLPNMVGTRYFFDPGLMRWANPKIKSDVTNMPVLMGRLLEHVEGNLYRTESIYPPAQNTDLEITVEGDAMVIIVKSDAAKPTLTITLKRKNNRSPKPPKEKMIGMAHEAIANEDLGAAYLFTQLQLINFPDDQEAAVLLADVRLDKALAMTSGFNKLELQRTQDQARWALEKNPDNHTTRGKLAAFLYRFTAFDAAVKQFEMLENAGQYDKDLMLQHVQALARLGKREEARNKLSEMLGYDAEQNQFNGQARITEPSNGYLLLANALVAEGNSEQAIAVLDHFVDRFPDLPKPYLDRGRLHLGMKKQERALEDFAKALEIAPNHRESMLVNIEVRMREPSDEPDQLIERAFEVLGRDPILLVLAGTRAGIKRDFEKALSYVEEGLTENPRNQGLVSLKIQLLAEKGDFAEAEALIRQLPELGAPIVVAQLMQAKLLITAKKFSKATRVLAGIDSTELPDTFKQQVQQVRDQLSRAMEAAATSSITDSLDPNTDNSSEGGADSTTPNPADDPLKLGSDTTDGSDSRP